MQEVFTEAKIPVKSWVTGLEEGAKEQALNLANLPFAFHHIALMPDAHQGFGMPIGGVLAANGVVVPNAVGVDIGCGMCAVSTDLDYREVDIPSVVSGVRKRVPVGFSRHVDECDDDEMPALTNWGAVVNKEYEAAKRSLGTLGGGNHFIELQKDHDNHLWVMVHSGSRNLGKQVADFYNKAAQKLNQQWFSSVTKDADLAFLPLDSDEAREYMVELEYCVAFAYLNRKKMVRCVLEELSCPDKKLELDVPHNYARMENHFGRNVMIHRKGATSAADGKLGIIPGSQGTSSYIVRGKGNADSFRSCSHGAGRKLGRKAAQRTLSLEAEMRRLDELGVLHSMQSVDDLDEAPSAYKDIDEVMHNQADLVDIVVKLTPLAVIKG